LVQFATDVGVCLKTARRRLKTARHHNTAGHRGTENVTSSTVLDALTYHTPWGYL